VSSLPWTMGPSYLIFTNWRHHRRHHVNPQKLKQSAIRSPVLLLKAVRSNIGGVLARCPTNTFYTEILPIARKKVPSDGTGRSLPRGHEPPSLSPTSNLYCGVKISGKSLYLGRIAGASNQASRDSNHLVSRHSQHLQTCDGCIYISTWKKQD
jgi:hypothetical protein